MGSLPRESDHITQATMNSFVCISAILAVAAAAPQFPGTYNGDASLAKILQEQRFNVGNDQFGHAAHQEDGTILRRRPPPETPESVNTNTSVMTARPTP